MPPSPALSHPAMPAGDVLIVGGGPAGLSLAIALAQAGVRSTVLEQQSAAQWAAPRDDGREIALTHPSVHTLQQLGSWALLAAHEQGPIHEAQVHTGALRAQPGLRLHSGTQPLGAIVPNHALRRTAYAVAAAHPLIHIEDSALVQQVHATPEHASVTFRRQGDATNALSTLSTLHAPLVVAADSRFSATRRQLGVGAQMHDFGRTVIVCRMRHQTPHGGIAHECFGDVRTLALLPLADDPDTDTPLCSVVITADTADATALLARSPQAFARQVEALCAQRLGAMALVGERHSYPLVATYAQRFAGARYALLGDAAVGMHPVTAHGFNLGLSGVASLTAAITTARQAGIDLGDARALAPYARQLHRHAWPVYHGTNAVVRLFTDPRPLPGLLRRAVLAGANRLPPLKGAIVGQLTGQPRAWLPPGLQGLQGRSTLEPL